MALPAGGTLTMTLADSAKGWQRMGKVNQADIVAYACVSGVSMTTARWTSSDGLPFATAAFLG